MRILVMQTTRFGDILQTIPIVSALKRKYPTANIDLLARKKFSSVGRLFSYFNTIDFDTEFFLQPAFKDLDYNEDSFWISLHRLELFCDNLKNKNYDLIINLSFSPMSSYMTYYISGGDSTRVKGYTRFSDGFLNIVDDTSAYFYSQVGVSSNNRFHVIDLLSSVAEVNLEASDYDLPFPTDQLISNPSYFIVHVGASSEKKALPSVKWNQILRELIASNYLPVLIGTAGEAELISRCIAGLNQDKIINMCGLTSSRDLFSLIHGAKFYLGADSGPLHICNFTDTKCYNLSNREVNFWETGPKSMYSRVWYEDNFLTLDAKQFVTELLVDLSGEESNFIKGDKWTPYSVQSTTFEWSMLQALYTGSDFPACGNSACLQALIQFNEVNDIVLHQLSRFKPDNKEQAGIIEVADQILDELAREQPEITPLYKWLSTEKTRVGPQPVDQIVLRYKELHFKAKQILSLYVGTSWKAVGGENEQDTI